DADARDGDRGNVVDRTGRESTRDRVEAPGLSALTEALRMPRHKRHEEHTNHEAWAIPYGDLITLLLAFFVVMYALSSVNEGKYRVLSQSIIEAFNGNSKRLEATPSHTPSVLAPLPDAGASLTATSWARRIELPLRRQPVPGKGEQPTVQR